MIDRTATTAIEAIAAELAEAWNRHDAQALAVVFAEDADFTNVFGMGRKGTCRDRGLLAIRAATPGRTEKAC